MTYKLGSLFDGSGGFPLAGSLCGIEPVWASEVEPYPIAVTRSRFPKMKHLGDVSKVNGGEIEPVDIITFGSPCQDMSVAGKRAGLKHEDNGDDETTRSGLFMEAIRIIKEMRETTHGRYPAFAVWENVPGAFSSNKGEDFRCVLQSLIQIVEPGAVVPDVPKGGWAYADWFMGCGWSLAYRVLDAQYWGVPQRRRRIYLVLDLRGERAGKILFERDRLRRNYTACGAAWERTPADAQAGIGADDRAREDGVARPVAVAPVASTLRAGAGAPKHEQDFVGRLVLEPVPNLLLDDQGGQQVNVRTDDKCPTLRAEAHGNVPAVVGVMASSAVNAEITDGAIAPCLMARAGTGGNQLPLVAVKEQYLFENHSQDARYRGPLDVCPMLPAQLGTDGNNQPFVVEQDKVYCIDGDKIGKAERSGGSGLGIRPGDKMYTLTAKDAGTHAVAFQTYQKVTGPLVANSHPGSYTGQDAFNDMLVAGKEETPIVLDRAFYNQGQNALYEPQFYTDGTVPTLVAKGPAAVAVRYIVRRLTPTECARLQGFPDKWGHPDRKEDFTDEEYCFWCDVVLTKALIDGAVIYNDDGELYFAKQNKPYKPKTKEQLLNWYNKLHTDSAEYKMWGNGIALPCALYVMQGIEDALKEESKWTS